jgi:hypothetical protein
MGFFSAKAVEVEEMLFDGATVAQISAALDISMEQVHAYIRELEEGDRDPYYDELERDHDEGYEPDYDDEDYGYAGEEF